MGTTIYDRGTVCPTCNIRLDAATGLTGRRPQPGDFTLCAACGAALRFTTPPQVRLAHDDELDELPSEARGALEVSREFIRSRSGHTTHFAKPVECPACDAKLRSSTNLVGLEPRPGDFSVCCACGSVLRVLALDRLQVVPADELDMLHPDVRCALERARDVIRGGVN